MAEKSSPPALPAGASRRAPASGHRSYRGFLIDADNTIFDYDRSEASALSQALGAAGIEARREVLDAYHAVNAGLWRDFEEGTVSQEELKVRRFSLLLERFGSSASPAALSADYLDRLSRTVWLLPHARGALGKLARRASLGLVTNGIAAVQRGRLARSGLERLFGAIVISGEAGIAKPDPRLFLRAASLLGLEPGDVLCVGDSPSSDIRGAQAAGMAACWVARGAPWPSALTPPDLVIHDLRGLLPLAPAPLAGRRG